ncbi:hypothetical protein pdam_00011911 [Pocillopora damicornis]|uniref:Uncharacterized protein n=1 Tax=Pocillopora damicornis TaxID=46731 RepID=A0A3M6V191_POCDA|nr:hypothetical protein pdam_00011911 [Pocillopora damicornis]
MIDRHKQRQNHRYSNKPNADYDQCNHGDVVGINKLTKEAAKSAIWEGAPDRNEGCYVCGGYVDKKIVGGRSHSGENFEYSNDERVTNKPNYDDYPHKHDTYDALR